MKTIKFPLDFSVTNNPYLDNEVNYMYERPNGSIISIIESKDYEGYYEIWDESFMDAPLLMDVKEINEYLKYNVIELFTHKFLINEYLHLN